MHDPKVAHFFFEKSGTLWENILFLWKYTIFGPIWEFIWTISFLHYFTALPIIDTVCFIFQHIV